MRFPQYNTPTRKIDKSDLNGLFSDVLKMFASKKLRNLKFFVESNTYFEANSKQNTNLNK